MSRSHPFDMCRPESLLLCSAHKKCKLFRVQFRTVVKYSLVLFSYDEKRKTLDCNRWNWDLRLEFQVCEMNVEMFATIQHLIFFDLMQLEKATNFWEIFPFLLTVCTVVKSKEKISRNFVAFSEYMNFNSRLGQKSLQKFVLFFWSV